LYCITDVRLMTFKSAIFARWVRISSCTPSAKYSFCLIVTQIVERENGDAFVRE
jgi:hypothetical protein